MEKEKRNIIKEKGENGSIVYRYPDCKTEISDHRFADGAIDWRFVLIMCKFNAFSL